MAVTAITLEKLKINTVDVDALATTAASVAADGFSIDANVADHKLLLIFDNTGASPYTITIKAGNGIQGVEDLTASIVAGKKAAVSIETGAFKNVSGTNKGKIIAIPENVAVKCAAIVLP